MSEEQCSVTVMFFVVSSRRGFLRSDKPIGTALVKLDKLESQSEIREIVEVGGISFKLNETCCGA